MLIYCVGGEQEGDEGPASAGQEEQPRDVKEPGEAGGSEQGRTTRTTRGDIRPSEMA